MFLSPQINELVDCRDISLGAWFEACIENVTLAPKGQPMPTKPRVGRPPKRTNVNLEAAQTTDNNSNKAGLNSESNGASTSQTDFTTKDSKDKEEEIIYHIKYEE